MALSVLCNLVLESMQPLREQTFTSMQVHRLVTLLLRRSFRCYENFSLSFEVRYFKKSASSQNYLKYVLYTNVIKTLEKSFS